MLVLKEEEERDVDCFGVEGALDCVEGPARAGGLTFHFVSSSV